MAQHKPTYDTYQMYIDGKWVDGTGGAPIEVLNPSTGGHLASIQQASKQDVDKAAAAARRAFETWGVTTTAQRAAILNKIADIIEKNADFLATIESMDNGKPIRETKAADIPLAVDHFRYFASVIRGEEGSATMLDPNTLSLILREPIGVVAQIVPWNFPFLMAAWKLAPAIAAGNTILFKPSSTTSLSVLELARLIHDVLPAGVLNVITGSGSKAGVFVQQADIDKIAFTGSTAVGREIGLGAAKKIIPATLELGGKSANVFFADCDRKMALEGVQLGILFNQGQVCSAGSRIFVEESFLEEFMDLTTKAFESVKVGDPLDPTTQMGAQISQEQMDKILEYIDIGQKEGAKVATGGKRLERNGYFMRPTLLTNVTNSMRVAQEEIFGPVGVVIPFKTEDDLVAMANDSVYGLGGGVFTENISKALRVANRMRTGRIWVNTYNIFPAGAPFGGYKESGIGRETHKSILLAYTQAKNVLINLADKPAGFYVKP